jgi:hypothetical protein
MIGVLTGCDRAQEALLPWWYAHFRAHNPDLPVTFADFGLSEQARRFAAERGQVIEVQGCQVGLLAEERERRWSPRWRGELGQIRQQWFKKPFACLASPYAHTLWLDADCQVRGDLSPLFVFLSLGYELALVPEPLRGQRVAQAEGYTRYGETSYSSGVVAFAPHSSVIAAWAKRTEEESGSFLGDQNALSLEIFLLKPPLFELPEAYNWRMEDGPNPEALILHYNGDARTALLEELRS